MGRICTADNAVARKLAQKKTQLRGKLAQWKRSCEESRRSEERSFEANRYSENAVARGIGGEKTQLRGNLAQYRRSCEESGRVKNAVVGDIGAAGN